MSVKVPKPPKMSSLQPIRYTPSQIFSQRGEGRGKPENNILAEGVNYQRFDADYSDYDSSKVNSYEKEIVLKHQADVIKTDITTHYLKIISKYKIKPVKGHLTLHILIYHGNTVAQM